MYPKNLEINVTRSMSRICCCWDKCLETQL